MLPSKNASHQSPLPYPLPPKRQVDSKWGKTDYFNMSTAPRGCTGLSGLAVSLINNKLPYTSYVLHGIPKSYRPIPSSKTLTFKMRLSAQPFLWKRVLFAREYHFDIKGWALKLVLIQRPGQLGNGLLVDGSQFPESPQPRSRSFPSQHLASTCIYLPVI